MHTEIYCTTLLELDRIAAIRAIHQAWLQLSHTQSLAKLDGFNNQPAIDALAACLTAAGHPAFTRT
jgi:hypothetical protein